jgi:hypothetical protein
VRQAPRDLAQIREEKRIPEQQFWLRFDQHKAAIFKALLDGLSAVLGNLPNTKLAKLPRMADGALWASAGETALGFEQGAFMTAYQQNLDEGAAAAVEGSAIGAVIRELLLNNSSWCGEMADLLAILNNQATEDQRRSYGWPKNPSALGQSLRRLAPALRRAGISCGFERPSNSRTVTLAVSNDTNDGDDRVSATLHGDFASGLRPEATIQDKTAKELAIARPKLDEPEIQI